jgi:hypothetical protein
MVTDQLSNAQLLDEVTATLGRIGRIVDRIAGAVEDNDDAKQQDKDVPPSERGFGT